MRQRSTRWWQVLAAPTLCVGILAGMVAQDRQRLTAEDFERYHAEVRQLVDSLPSAIENWMGAKAEVPASAQTLLRPNALRAIRFVDMQPRYVLGNPRGVLLVVVQCKAAADMVGHYPPNCYRGQGFEQIDRRSRDWIVDGVGIPGTEYTFSRTIDRQTSKTVVYNFMMVPRKGIQRDIAGVRAAAEDYQQRYYGAAQVQVVFSGPMADLNVSERDEIFATLIRPALPVIAKMSEGASDL
jgi:hypothetical protein